MFKFNFINRMFNFIGYYPKPIDIDLKSKIIALLCIFLLMIGLFSKIGIIIIFIILLLLGIVIGMDAIITIQEDDNDTPN